MIRILIFGFLLFCLGVVKIKALPIYDKHDTVTDVNTLPSINVIDDSVIQINNIDVETKNVSVVNMTSLRTVRPGMTVLSYNIEIDPHVQSDTFTGRLSVQVSLTQDTREEPIIFHSVDLSIHSVLYAIGTGSGFTETDFNVDDEDGLLEIEIDNVASRYTLIIEYDGPIRDDGTGIYRGTYEDK